MGAYQRKVIGLAKIEVNRPLIAHAIAGGMVQDVTPRPALESFRFRLRHIQLL